MICSALFTTLFIGLAQSIKGTQYCTNVANCTDEDYKRDYQCNNGVCEERTCYNDTACINNFWYGSGYRCNMSTMNYECINDCADDSDCTSGYLCSMYRSCVECLNNTDCTVGVCDYNSCVDCAENNDCPVGEYCDSNSCEISCNGNDTFCAVQSSWWDKCDSSGVCVHRECYSDVDCDNLNYTNYRCDTSYIGSWSCVEKCNATSCVYYQPICNSNGECENENCVNTPNYCSLGTETCNATTGYCDTIPCQSNSDCDSAQGWFCDEIRRICYMNCSNYNSSYCNSVMYGKYYNYNYECDNGGECLHQECTADIDCQIKYNASYLLCVNVTKIGQTFCTYPTCINTPGYC
eukprot:6221_1